MVSALGGEESPIRAHCRGASALLNYVGFRVGSGEVPDPDRFIAASTGDVISIRTECHHGHFGFMPLECSQIPARRGIPYPDRLVSAAAHKPLSVTAERH